MALTINSGGSTILAEGISADSGTTSGTVTTTGTNRVGYVAIGCSRFASGSMSVTWGGNAMTLAEDRYTSANTSYAAIFYLINPPTAASSIAWSGGSTSIGGIIAFSAQDNHQTTPFGTSAEADTNTLAIPSATGEIAIASIFTYSGSSTAVDSPATMIGTANIGAYNGSVAQIAGASSTVTITFGGGIPIVGVSLKPVSGGGGTPAGGTNYYTRLIANSQI